MRNSKPRVLSVLLVVILTLTATRASGQVGIPEDSDRWHFQLTPYFWAAGIKGDVGIAGTLSPVDASFGDIAENLDFAFAAHAEAARGKWKLLADLLYINLGSSAFDETRVQVDVDIQTLQAEVAGVTRSFFGTDRRPGG